MSSYRCHIKGRVQGVFYRKSIQALASQAGYNGYVKNMSDGSVEACVTCKQERLENFIALLRKGSQANRVDSVEILPCDETFEAGFTIRY